MDSNVSTDTRPSASFQGEMLQTAGESCCQNSSGQLLPPSFCNPSQTQGQDPAEDLDQERAEAVPASCLMASSTQQSSNPPMLPKDHPLTLFPSCLSLPFCQRNHDHTPHQQRTGQCWHDTMTMDQQLLSSRTCCT